MRARLPVAGLAACVLVWLPAPGQAEATGARLDALIEAYPDHLSHTQGNLLVWHDGSTSGIDDGRAKDHPAKLEDADIEDMLSQAYPVGPCSYAAPGRNDDPGRIRVEAVFRHMYGRTRAEASGRLVSLDWFGTVVQVTTVNGVHDALVRVRDELDALDRVQRDTFTTTAGTFNWRTISGTDRLSVHSFGAAIDLNVDYADYWKWTGAEAGNVPGYRNRMPHEVVEVFERHGFIWGGKWYHYDTMHFEYRPELLALAVTADCAGE